MTNTIDVKFAVRMRNGNVTISKVKLEFDEPIHPSEIHPFITDYVKNTYPIARTVLSEVPRL